MLHAQSRYFSYHSPHYCGELELLLAMNRDYYDITVHTGDSAHFAAVSFASQYDFGAIMIKYN